MKRFAASAIALRADPFRWARLKLTFSYLAMITAIVVILSSSVYSFHALGVRRNAHEVYERMERDGQLGAPFDPAARGPGPGPGPAPGPFEHSFADDLEDLRRSIIFGDVITIVVAGVLSYLLAGMTLRPIRKTTESQARFFASAAHDLRTPLAVMRTEAEVALRNTSGTLEEARAIVQSGLEEVKRMAAMVEQMMILSRDFAASGARTLDVENLNVAVLLRSVVAKISPLAEERGVLLAATALAPATVRANIEALERALYNVVENAIRYTPPGGNVVLETVHAGSHVLVTVRDTGIGIRAKDLPHVTEPFYRADEARSGNTGGSGLGLTIVKETLAAFGGTIHIESAPGRGTAVHLKLPAA